MIEGDIEQVKPRAICRKKAEEEKRRSKDSLMHEIMVAGGAPEGYGEDSGIVSYF